MCELYETQIETATSQAKISNLFSHFGVPEEFIIDKTWKALTNSHLIPLGAEKATLLYILKHMDYDTQTFVVCQKKIAERLGLHKDTVKAHLRKLRDRGVVSTDSRYFPKPETMLEIANYKGGAGRQLANMYYVSYEAIQSMVRRVIRQTRDLLEAKYSTTPVDNCVDKVASSVEKNPVHFSSTPPEHTPFITGNLSTGKKDQKIKRSFSKEEIFVSEEEKEQSIEKPVVKKVGNLEHLLKPILPASEHAKESPESVQRAVCQEIVQEASEPPQVENQPTDLPKEPKPSENRAQAVPEGFKGSLSVWDNLQALKNTISSSLAKAKSDRIAKREQCQSVIDDPFKKEIHYGRNNKVPSLGKSQSIKT